MKISITLLFLFIFFSSKAQQKMFSENTFSVGYGYYDIFQKYQQSKIESGYNYKEKNIYNYKTSLAGPVYFKLETKLSKRAGLALCLGYDHFSYAGDFDMYKVRNGNEVKYFVGNPKYLAEYDTIIDKRKGSEHLSFSSFSMILRLNLYLVSKDNFQLYIGSGIGYRTHQDVVKTNIQEVYPELGTIYTMQDWLYDFFSSPVSFEMTLGGRGYFSKHWGVYSEIGIAKSLLQAGVCYRMN